MKQIYLIRHAKAAMEGSDVERILDEDGIRQMDQLTKVLIDLKISPNILYSSPYKRAMQTIEKFANHLNIKINTHIDLREKTISTKPINDIQEVRKKMWDDLNFRLDDGETSKEVQDRGMNVVNNVMHQLRDGQIGMIVSHGNFLALIINYFDNKFVYENWLNMSMPDIFKLIIDEDKVKIEHIGVQGVESFKI